MFVVLEGWKRKLGGGDGVEGEAEFGAALVVEGLLLLL